MPDKSENPQDFPPPPPTFLFLHAMVIKSTIFIPERNSYEQRHMLNSLDAYVCLRNNIPLFSKLQTSQDDYMASVAVLASPTALLKSHL